TLCSTNDDPSNPDFGDVAWRTSNLDENFFVTDYRQFEVFFIFREQINTEIFRLESKNTGSETTKSSNA
ncbi:unnamed protein product, partial [Oikopleura dioica]